MEENQKIQTEITQNTIKSLFSKFDKLLLGTDTKEYGFKSLAEKELKIKEIKILVDYRLKEKIINQKSDLWKVLCEIKTKDIGKKEISVKILEKLFLIYTKNVYLHPIQLNSQEAKRISTYSKQKAREENAKRGEGVLIRFFKIFQRKQSVQF